MKKSVKQDTTPVSANLGWNARLSEECAKILALIKTGGYDGCNPYRQKYYTKWKDELIHVQSPYNEHDLRQFAKRGTYLLMAAFLGTS